VTVWSMPQVEDNPFVHLVRWRVYRFVVGEEKLDILSGWDLENACGRCSTPVVQVEVGAKTVRTRSGRRYLLNGAPGFDDDAHYVFEARFGPPNDRGVPRVDVTDEYWAMVGPIEMRIDQGSSVARAILRKAEQVFGDVDKARRWLSSPSPILADIPLSLFGSRAGRRLVYDELVRIDLGDYA